MKSCSGLDKESLLKIKISDFKNPCFFFKTKGEEFTVAEIVPNNICPDLFFSIYPQYLSMLYSKKNNHIKVTCPGTCGKTTWLIYTKYMLLSPLLKLAEMFFRLIGKPKDIYIKKVAIKFIAKKGTCPYGYGKKNKFSFNQYSRLWNKRYFCPAVFYTIYPFLISNMKSENANDLIQCPADCASIQLFFNPPK